MIWSKTLQIESLASNILSRSDIHHLLLSHALPRLSSYEARRSLGAPQQLLALQIANIIHQPVETKVGTQVESMV